MLWMQLAKVKPQLVFIWNWFSVIKYFFYFKGIKAKNGVVLATEKKLSSILIDEESYNKIVHIGDHIGATYAGLGPDFRILMTKSRKIVNKHKL